MLAFYATLTVRPEDGPALEAIVADLKMVVTAREPDVRLYQLCRSREESGVYHMMELYTNQAARERHESTEWFRAAEPKFMGLLIRDLAVETYDAL